PALGRAFRRLLLRLCLRPVVPPRGVGGGAPRVRPHRPRDDRRLRRRRGPRRSFRGGGGRRPGRRRPLVDADLLLRPDDGPRRAPPRTVRLPRLLRRPRPRRGGRRLRREPPRRLVRRPRRGPRRPRSVAAPRHRGGSRRRSGRSGRGRRILLRRLLRHRGGQATPPAVGVDRPVRLARVDDRVLGRFDGRAAEGAASARPVRGGISEALQGGGADRLERGAEARGEGGERREEGKRGRRRGGRRERGGGGDGRRGGGGRRRGAGRRRGRRGSYGGRRAREGRRSGRRRGRGGGGESLPRSRRLPRPLGRSSLQRRRRTPPQLGGERLLRERSPDPQRRPRSVRRSLLRSVAVVLVPLPPPSPPPRRRPHLLRPPPSPGVHGRQDPAPPAAMGGPSRRGRGRLGELSSHGGAHPGGVEERPRRAGEGGADGELGARSAGDALDVRQGGGGGAGARVQGGDGSDGDRRRRSGRRRRRSEGGMEGGDRGV
ncbi:hypothetical protein ACHAWF_009904, partial [Thalassiosira exigua]